MKRSDLYSSRVYAIETRVERNYVKMTRKREKEKGKHRRTNAINTVVAFNQNGAKPKVRFTTHTIREQVVRTRTVKIHLILPILISSLLYPDLSYARFYLSPPYIGPSNEAPSDTHAHRDLPSRLPLPVSPYNLVLRFLMVSGHTE